MHVAVQAAAQMMRALQVLPVLWAAPGAVFASQRRSQRQQRRRRQRRQQRWQRWQQEWRRRERPGNSAYRRWVGFSVLAHWPVAFIQVVIRAGLWCVRASVVVLVVIGNFGVSHVGVCSAPGR